MRYLILLAAMISGYLLADFRQTETFREYEYDYDLTGGEQGTFLDISTAVSGSRTIPLNVIVSDVKIKVIEPFTSSSGASITIGNSFDSDGYLKAKDISEFTDNATFQADGDLVFDDSTKLTRPYLVSGTADRDIGLTVSAGTSLTAGRARVIIKTYLPGVD